MAKNNHYTSDHWKVGGSGFSGENILHEVGKQQYAQAKKSQKENASLIPNQEQHLQEQHQQEQQQDHNETPAAKGGNNRSGDATTSANSSSSDY